MANSGEDLAQQVSKVRIADDDEGFFKKGTRTNKTMSTGANSDRANRATQDQVLDPRTRMILFKMINRGLFDEFRGCLSTGKEANVYRAVILDSNQQLAVKVYKTAILAFKDRERYVTGEFRFQQGYSRSNSRKMVKLWAEKETRNLKRIYRSDIPVPKPLHLDHHVLVMEFLGDENGWPSPKLKDADVEGDAYPELYIQLLAYMRIMYQECRLVHGDLSEYNLLYHQQKLWMIDVSQSVEHDHPNSLDFLRMDIKNVNDYFRRQGVEVFSERRVFEFITTPAARGAPWPEKTVNLMASLRQLPEEENSNQETEDAVFRNIYIPRNLNEVFDADRDSERVRAGERDELVYKHMLGTDSPQGDQAGPAEQSLSGTSERLEQQEVTKAGNSSEPESGSGSESESESESDSDKDHSSEDEGDEDDGPTDVWAEGWDERLDRESKERKFKDRESNKERKKQVKDEARQKRATKLKKKDKKKIIAKLKSKKPSKR